MQNYTNTMLCWNPGGEVALVPLGGRDAYGYNFLMSGGAAYAGIRTATFEQRKLHVFIDAVTLIVRDKCDPKKVHNALLGLEEYVDGLPTDMLTGDLLLNRHVEDGEVVL